MKEPNKMKVTNIAFTTFVKNVNTTTLSAMESELLENQSRLELKLSRQPRFGRLQIDRTSQRLEAEIEIIHAELTQRQFAA